METFEIHQVRKGRETGTIVATAETKDEAEAVAAWYASVPEYRCAWLEFKVIDRSASPVADAAVRTTPEGWARSMTRAEAWQMMPGAVRRRGNLKRARGGSRF